MCLREDPREAEEAEGGGSARVAPGAPATPSPLPRPAPRRLLCSTARIAAGTRSGHGDPWRPGRSEKAKVRQAALQVFPTSPPAAAGVQLLGASLRR